MKKKLTGALLVGVLCLTLSATVAASGDDVIYNRYTENTSQFLVTISRPEGDETTYKKTYVVSGSTVIIGETNDENVTVELLVLDNTKDKYVPIETASGENCWNIGFPGVFAKQVKLPKDGNNDIRVAAYKNFYKEEEDSKLELGENLQVNDYTITVVNEESRGAFRNGFLKISGVLNRLFR